MSIIRFLNTFIILIKEIDNEFQNYTNLIYGDNIEESNLNDYYTDNIISLPI